MSDLIFEIIISALILIGVSFCFVGSLGLLKLPDFYMRVHVPTKATTLGIGSLLIASTIFFSLLRGAPAVHEILIVLFLFMTAPISAHMMMKAGLHQRLPDVDGEVEKHLGS